TINSYGMEVVSGIIMGLDTDKPGTADALLSFIDQSQIPLLTINLLQALPKTPLWDRLAKEGRLVNDDDGRDSNVEFLLPYEQVVESWRKCMEVAYQPEKLFARYQYQCDYTYAQRIKVPVTPEQIIAELDKMRECGIPDTVYFVDDNFIGNRKAALDLLPHLIEWQKRTGYVLRLACEATLNIAKRPEILEKMREAFFVTIFCGIETPDPEALKQMHKDHNMMVPILEGVQTINSYGMEVVSGIIMGLDTDKPGTADALLAFIDQSKIPLLTINLLQALPKTPLWDRLERENRLVHDDEARDSNVKFLLPSDAVVGSRKRCMEIAYDPEKLFERWRHQCDYTFRNRLKVPLSPEMKSWANIRRGLIMLRNIFWKVGVLGDYRRVFWRFALERLRRGDIEGLIQSVLIGHHLIVFARAASSGRQNASNYSLRLREAQVPAE
ncbi:MAG TPA: DUF4070 domain-containing protein, partial [Bradyrhizobium sp.]|nr:DUF4070 domain-containing protein [Bradyrhizobium sp.]